MASHNPLFLFTRWVFLVLAALIDIFSQKMVFGSFAYYPGKATDRVEAGRMCVTFLLHEGVMGC